MNADHHLCLFAHQGAMGAQAPANSRDAIVLAIGHGYDGVEIDIREGTDGSAIVRHDPVVGREAAVLPLEECLGLCGDSTHLLVDVKEPPCSKGFLRQVWQLLQDHQIASRTWVYPPRTDLQTYFRGKIRVGVALDRLPAITSEANTSLFCFVIGWPDEWSEEKVTRCHALSVPAVSTVKRSYFRRTGQADEMDWAAEELARLVAIGIDAVIVDHCYHGAAWRSRRSGGQGGPSLKP